MHQVLIKYTIAQNVSKKNTFKTLCICQKPSMDRNCCLIGFFFVYSDTTVYNRTVLKNGSCCTVRPGKVSCLQKFRHFWMIIRDLFFESGSTEATKIKKILQRYVMYISDQITLPYLNTETGNRRLNIVDVMFSLVEKG